MSASKQRSPSPLGRILKEYRDKYGITQEQFANELSVDVRTLRRYENGESVLTDIVELRRIATVLGIEPERLGVAASLFLPLQPEQVDMVIENVWSLVRNGRTYEANVLVDRLIHDLTSQIVTEEPTLLSRLARAQHLAGYVKSVLTKADEAAIPRAHYHEMELLARLLNDQTLLNLALTYQGDMYCRSGDTLRSVEYLESARDTTPLADKAARGNGIQLLGRSYLRANRLGDFERAMREAEEISALLEEDGNTLSTHGQYSLGTVYEEYGRTYAILGQTQQAMDYLDKAEQTLSPTKHWEILLKTARSMALVHDGEINEGVKLAVESANLCRKHGTIRLMERIYGVQRYLDKMTRDIGQASSLLRDALCGPVEF